MTPLAPSDLSRLARVLALLGSPHQGERDAAALAADRLVRGRGLDWLEVLGAIRPEPPRSRPGWATPPASDHVSMVEFCQRHSNRLTIWELGFVANLAARRTVTDKQRVTLASIVAKVRSTGPCAA